MRKISIHGYTLLVALCAFSNLQAANSDLSYTSPSTGADGPLSIPGTLPLFGTDSTPIELAYDVANGYLMAVAIPTESSQYLQTFAQKDGKWEYLKYQNRYLAEVKLVYDAARNEVLRIGGFFTSNDSYTFPLDYWNGTEWVNKPFQETRPSSRSSIGAAFDSARGEVVIFGGVNNDGELNDTWVWNGTNWTDKTPGTSPNPRQWPSMAFDAARGEVVMFGGRYENDTWTWNGSIWTEESPSNVPPSKESSSMAYDPNRQVVVLCLSGSGGDLETWEWNGSEWTEIDSSSDPGERNFHGLVYNPETSSVQLHNGEYPNNYDRKGDSWSWNGSSWDPLSVSPYSFDMSVKPDGIWNLTTIDVGSTEVRFTKNPANTPVVWLATGDVNIDGHLNLDGTTAYQGYVSSQEPYNTAAPGGPAGFDGGLGGYYETATGDNVSGAPGVGPGGGAASLTGAASGDQDGFHATHFGSYNSPSLQALSGGSGGGGAASTTFSASNEWGRGGNGGGGGGAILIASSRDMFINGTVTAIGGEGRYGSYKITNNNTIRTGTSQGGSGSAGSIRLVADRVFLDNGGALKVTSDINNSHDRDDTEENKGRIRIEAFFHNITSQDSTNWGHYSVSTPRTTLLGANAPTLTIDSIAGQNVSVNPSSDPAAPEVTFSSAGAINIALSASNIPDGSDVNLRVTSGPETITATPQTLAGGSASFSVIVPAGSGVVQAWTDSEVGP